ncbi:hypothetical protein BGW37DRAFT_498957 [Umbelopsis sp. PMI_123]|nr:hypothetical protein BGW37DRAFT_498957 [Umbelopsis sp. PMI_123]
MKRRAPNSDNEDGSDAEEELDAVSRLMNRSFTAFRCTPFWEFHAAQMTKYEKQLKDYLMLDLERALKEARDNAEDEEETLDLLRGRVVQVELKGQTISPWRGSDPSVRPFEMTMVFQPRGKTVQKVYTAIFMPALAPSPIQLAPGFSHYALALIKADAPIMPLIVRWFESNFGGHISPMRIPPWELEMITEEWASRVYDTRESLVQDIIRVPRTRKLDLPLELRYDTGLDDIKSITVNVTAEDVMTLVKTQRTLNGNKRLVDLIQQHIFDTTSIDVTKLVLSRVGNPACYISTDGKVKLMANQSKTLTLQVMRRLMAVACERAFGP